MAQRTQVVIIDDLDGTEIEDGDGQTVTFAVGTTAYEIDLSKANVDKFYDALTPYMENGRRISGRRSSSSQSSPRPSASTDKEQLQAAREWLRSQGHEVSSRGRIKSELMDLYNAAH